MTTTPLRLPASAPRLLVAAWLLLWGIAALGAIHTPGGQTLSSQTGGFESWMDGPALGVPGGSPRLPSGLRASGHNLDTGELDPGALPWPLIATLPHGAGESKPTGTLRPSPASTPLTPYAPRGPPAD